MTNILFKASKVKKQEQKAQFAASNMIPPTCPKSGKPMVRVICGTPSGRKFYAWASLDENIALPAYNQ